MTILLDGKSLAYNIKRQINSELLGYKNRPGLAVILVGNNPASKIYVSSKEKDCQECGINSLTYPLPEDASQDEVLKLIDELNVNPQIHGILVQLPLPAHINEQAVINRISPNKDVDCFHPYNVGKLYLGQPTFKPCTPAGIMTLIKEYGIPVEGKHCVVVGRSNIVGKPMAALLTRANATVTLCHSKTKDLDVITRQADILISAVGKPGFITGNMVRNGTTVIDVAMNHDAQGKLCGDIEFESVAWKTDFITPVPGGVGPMTRATLMQNVLDSFKGLYLDT